NICHVPGLQGFCGCSAAQGVSPYHALSNPRIRRFEMKSLTWILAAFVTAAIAVVPAANAAGPNVHVIAAGSSALYTQTAIAAVNDVAPIALAHNAPGGSIHHFTIKGTTCAEGQCAKLHDGRAAIVDETATYWAAWVCPAGGCNGANATDVWSDSQVDSIVGD